MTANPRFGTWPRHSYGTRDVSNARSATLPTPLGAKIFSRAMCGSGGIMSSEAHAHDPRSDVPPAACPPVRAPASHAAVSQCPSPSDCPPIGRMQRLSIPDRLLVNCVGVAHRPGRSCFPRRGLSLPVSPGSHSHHSLHKDLIHERRSKRMVGKERGGRETTGGGGDATGRSKWEGQFAKMSESEASAAINEARRFAVREGGATRLRPLRNACLHEPQAAPLPGKDQCPCVAARGGRLTGWP